MTTSPLTAGTNVGDSPGGEFHSRTRVVDTAGADAVGVVTAAPAANTILGRLKAIADNTDSLEGFLDGVEALITGTNTALGTLNSYNDGVEGLLTDIRTALLAQSGYQDGVETLLGAGNDAALLIAPARNAFAITPTDANTAITPLPRAVRVNTAGTVTYRAVDASADVTITVAAGEVIQDRIVYLRATGTSASGFVGKA